MNFQCVVVTRTIESISSFYACLLQIRSAEKLYNIVCYITNARIPAIDVPFYGSSIDNNGVACSVGGIGSPCPTTEYISNNRPIGNSHSIVCGDTSIRTNREILPTKDVTCYCSPIDGNSVAFNSSNAVRIPTVDITFDGTSTNNNGVIHDIASTSSIHISAINT